MTLEQNLNDKNQLSMEEMTLQLEELEKNYQFLLEELGLTSEQLQDYTQNSENFSSDLWRQLQSEKQQLDQKLDLLLANLPNPEKVKKSLAEKSSIQQHWIFVR